MTALAVWTAKAVTTNETATLFVDSYLVPPEYYAVPWRGKWETELGGCSMGHGIHAMDFLLYQFGDWQEVRSMIGALDRDMEVEDVSMAMVRFANGAMANITNSVLSPRQETYLRFDFQRATAELTQLYSYDNEQWCYTAQDDFHDQLATWQEMPPNRHSTHGAQLTVLLDSMERNERPLVSGPAARGTIEFLAALYKSGMTGQPVTRGSITPGGAFYRRMCGPCDQAWQEMAV